MFAWWYYNWEPWTLTCPNRFKATYEDKLFSADDSATKLIAVLQPAEEDTGLFLTADKRIEW